MNLAVELLIASHQADLWREARERRLSALLDQCRRWLFGVIPVTQTCQTCCA
jgi:hypothetical protein